MKQLNECMDRFQYLSFDFFDTIVARDIEPEQVKKIWCHEMVKTYGIALSSKQLYQKRFELEKQLCDESTSEGFDPEFLIDDLYYRLAPLFGACTKKAIESFISFALDLELTIEKRYLKLTDNFKGFLNTLKGKKQSKCKIIIISDFYLTAEHIKNFLDHLEVPEIFEDIYVSSKYKVKKSGGGLFEIIMKDLNIEAKDIFHVGDNQLADIDMAAKHGIDSLKVEKDEAFYKSCLKQYGNKKNLESLLKDLGPGQFEPVTILLYKFCEDLMFSCLRLETKQLLFMAREGQFLKKIFDIYKETNFPNIKLTTSYFYVSRRATYLPSLQSLESGEKFTRLLRQYTKNSISALLKSLNLYDDELVASLSQRFDLEQMHEPFATSDAFNQLLKDEVFVKAYEKKRTQQKNEIKTYVNSILEPRIETLDMVDVGWKGSIQNNLANIFGEDYDIRGHYVGLQPGATSSARNQKTGYLIDQNAVGRGDPKNIFMESTALLESLLSADHGSTTCYENTKPVLEENDTEHYTFDNFVAPYQKKAADDFTKLCKEVPKYELNRDHFDRIFTEVYTHWICHPTKSEISVFSQLKHYENFGCMNYSDFSNTYSAMSFFKDFIKNPEFTLGSQWWTSVTLLSNKMNLINFFYYQMKARRISRYQWDKKTQTSGNASSGGNDSAAQANVAEFQKAIEAQTTMIDERDKYISELEHKYNEAIQAISNQDQMVKERDDYIKQLEERLNA